MFAFFKQIDENPTQSYLVQQVKEQESDSVTASQIIPTSHQFALQQSQQALVPTVQSNTIPSALTSQEQPVPPQTNTTPIPTQQTPITPHQSSQTQHQVKEMLGFFPTPSLLKTNLVISVFFIFISISKHSLFQFRMPTQVRSLREIQSR